MTAHRLGAPGDRPYGVTPVDAIDTLPDVIPGRKVFFHPVVPTRPHWIWHILGLVGWEIAGAADQADWRVLYDLETKVVLPPDDAHVDRAGAWLNGGCVDISKRRVQADFERVFGYPLAVDPTTWRGRCLRKADQNCVKDAIILDCPITKAALAPGQVYERLVDGSDGDGRLVETRVFVAGAMLPIVRQKLLANWHDQRRLKSKILHHQALPPSQVFSDQEIALLIEFSAAAGLDLGCLDVIRDREDGRIYVLDVTKTPGYSQSTRGDQAALAVIARNFARAWQASFPPARP